MLIYIIDLKAKKETEAVLFQRQAGNGCHRLEASIVERAAKEHSGARVLKG